MSKRSLWEWLIKVQYAKFINSCTNINIKMYEIWCTNLCFNLFIQRISWFESIKIEIFYLFLHWLLCCFTQYDKIFLNEQKRIRNDCHLSESTMREMMFVYCIRSHQAIPPNDMIRNNVPTVLLYLYSHSFSLIPLFPIFNSFLLWCVIDCDQHCFEIHHNTRTR